MKNLTLQKKFICLLTVAGTLVLLMCHTQPACAMQRDSIARLISVGGVADRGGRDYMEDESVALLPLDDRQNNGLIGVFDGHSGARAAQTAARLFPRQFRQLHAYLEQIAADPALVATLALGPGGRAPALIEQQVAGHFRAVEGEIMGMPSEDPGEIFETSGTTAALAHLWHSGDNHVRVLLANCGDSRIAIGDKDGRLRIATTDHKPDLLSERERIFDAGGYLSRDLLIELLPTPDGGQLCYPMVQMIARRDQPLEQTEPRMITASWAPRQFDGRRLSPLYTPVTLPDGKHAIWHPTRVSGTLSLSRSLGDRLVKEDDAPVIPQPDVYGPFILDKGSIIVLGTDGLWDAVSSEEAVAMAAAHIFPGGQVPANHGEEAMRCCSAAQALQAEAVHRGSNDNISVFIAVHSGNAGAAQTIVR